MIRQLFAQEEFRECRKGTAEEHNEDNRQMHGYEKYENIQDWRASAEKETELPLDPIADKAIEYELRCSEFGLNKHRFDYLIDPPLFGIKNIFDEEIIQSQIKAMKELSG